MKNSVSAVCAIMFIALIQLTIIGAQIPCDCAHTTGASSSRLVALNGTRDCCKNYNDNFELALDPRMKRPSCVIRKTSGPDPEVSGNYGVEPFQKCCEEAGWKLLGRCNQYLIKNFKKNEIN